MKERRLNMINRPSGGLVDSRCASSACGYLRFQNKCCPREESLAFSGAAKISRGMHAGHAPHLSASCSNVSTLPSHKCSRRSASSSKSAEDDSASPSADIRIPEFSREATRPHQSCMAALPISRMPLKRCTSALRPHGPAGVNKQLCHATNA
jgi:hypothetical protein